MAKQSDACEESEVSGQCSSEAPALNTYVSNHSQQNYYEDFLKKENTKYMGFHIHRKVNFPKYYKLFRTNPETNRINQLMLCKFRHCRATFTKISNLRDHLNVHDSVRHHKCEHCGKDFVQLGNLRRHYYYCKKRALSKGIKLKHRQSKVTKA
jgi:hypothetical protein